MEARFYATVDDMSSTRFSRLSSLLIGILAFFPQMALAGKLIVSIGTPSNLQAITMRVVIFLADTITVIATAMFLVGAFMVVLAGAKEDYKQRGKDLMIGSLLSVGVVLGAYALYRTVAAFLA